jgi:hypothetical protein
VAPGTQAGVAGFAGALGGGAATTASGSRFSSIGGRGACWPQYTVASLFSIST